MNAIITGSRAYGTPRDDSDIDLVVLVSEDDMMNLVGVASMFGGKKAIDPKMEKPNERYGPGASAAVLRFGQLNLIVTTDPLSFEVWRRGTERLKLHVANSGERVTRELAVAYLRELRAYCGVSRDDEAEPNPSDVSVETDEW